MVVSRVLDMIESISVGTNSTWCVNTRVPYIEGTDDIDERV